MNSKWTGPYVARSTQYESSKCFLTSNLTQSLKTLFIQVIFFSMPNIHTPVAAPETTQASVRILQHESWSLKAAAGETGGLPR